MKKILLSLLFLTSNVFAEPVTLNFVFLDTNSGAETTGFIVLETDFINNPGENNIQLPSPAVLDLQLTVTGTSFSDGNYDISDYSEIAFDTNGGVLDFSRPLIGQSTEDDPWGTTYDGDAGDFNFFTAFDALSDGNEARYDNLTSTSGVVISDAPTGCWYFTLCENDGESTPQGTPVEMVLQSLAPAGSQPSVSSVPTLSLWTIVLMSLALLTVVVLKRKRQA